MLRGVRFVVLALVVGAAVLVIRAHAEAQSETPEIQLQLGTLLFGEGRYLDAFQAFGRAVQSDDFDVVRRARPGFIQSSLRVAQFDIARTQAEELLKSAPDDPGALALYGDALWADGPVPGRRGRSTATPLAIEPGPGARPPRHGAGAARAQPAGRGDERGADGAPPGAARPRDPPHGRLDLRADAPVRGSGRRVRATTSTCCPTRTRATRRTGRAPRSASCARSATACRSSPTAMTATRSTTCRSVWRTTRSSCGSRVNGSSPQDFVVDTGSENTVVTRAHGPAPAASSPSPTR